MLYDNQTEVSVRTWGTAADGGVVSGNERGLMGPSERRR